LIHGNLPFNYHCNSTVKKIEASPYKKSKNQRVTPVYIEEISNKFQEKIYFLCGVDYFAWMALSWPRARAVVAALTDKHGIVAARLSAYGCGPWAPVAPTI
jgi:hypothetical protein